LATYDPAIHAKGDGVYKSGYDNITTGTIPEPGSLPVAALALLALRQWRRGSVGSGEKRCQCDG